jgi:hypothetical protein
MPSQQSHLNDFRKGKHVLFCHLSIFKGRMVLEGDVTSTTSAGDGNVVVIGYTGTDGDWEAVRAGFRVDVFTDDGRFKGRTRIRYGHDSGITSTTLPIKETSAGTVQIGVGDIVRVYRDVRPDIKLPAQKDTFPPEDEVYTNKMNNPPPLVNSGSVWAGYSRMLPVIMTDASVALDPASLGLFTHTWDEDGLTYNSGSSSSASPQFTGAAGEYCPSHTVEDNYNLNATTQFLPVIIHDKSYPPYKVVVESLPNNEERGGSATVRVLGNVPLADVPDGALAILWEEEYIAGTRQSFGARAPGRSHILLVGYLRVEDGEFDGETGVETLTFEIISAIARMDELMGYGHVMINADPANDWLHVKELTVWRAIALTASIHGNFNEAGHDFVKTSTFRDELYSGLAIEQGTPLKQMRDLAKSTLGRLIEDRRGRFEVQMRPEYVALDSRAALTRTLSMTARDIKNWHYTRQHWRPVNRVELQALVAGSTVAQNTPLFAEWTGVAPGGGNQQTTYEKAIVPATNSQARANEYVGRIGAALDGIYVDADGVLQMALDLETTHRGVYDLFDFYDEVVEIDVAANKRGIDFSDHLFVFVSSDVSFDNGTAETTIRWRTCTNGAAGAKYTPPPPPTTPDDGQPPTVPLPPTQPTDPTLGSGRYIVIDSTGRLWRTGDGNSVSPSWFATDLFLADAVLDFVPYAFSPLYLGTGTVLYLYVLTVTHIYRVAFDSVNFSVSVSDLKTFTAINVGRIETERGIPGLVAAVLNRTGISTEVVISTDGTTFGAPILINADATPYHASGLYVSGRSNRIFVSESILDAPTVGKVSVGGGAFSTLTSPNIASVGSAYGLHVPWHNNSDESIAYFGYNAGAGLPRRIYRANGSGAPTDISPVDGTSFGLQVPRGIDTAPDNRLRVACCLRNGTAASPPAFNSDLVRLYLSKDGGNSWSYIPALQKTVGANAYGNVRIFPDGSGGLVMGAVGQIAVWDFDGNSRDISGNLNADGAGWLPNVVGY